MNVCASRVIILFVISMLLGCANISTPTGGKKDKTPPKLVSITPKDSLLNTRVTKIEMHFDEYITVGDVSTEVETSPILSIPPSVIGLNKKVTVKIVDSLLDSNTTYRIKFGKSIKDLHEGNPFRKYTYIFSTGSYFDSLQLAGSVIDAASGLPDTSNVVELYYASAKDSDVIRKKPKYITKTDNKGYFLFKGLPKKVFRLYALKESTHNLIYDGIGEKIAFNDSLVVPNDKRDTTIEKILLRLFEEKPDTALSAKKSDSLKIKNKTDTTGIKRHPDSASNINRHADKSKIKVKDTALFYSVNIDTANIEKRSFDIAHNNPVKISFNKKAIFNKDKVLLTYDSLGVNVGPAYSIFTDTIHPFVYQIKTGWRENTVYTLKLAKGFAKDTSGADVMPSRYKFRTLEGEDYGKLQINLPSKYHDTLYVLRVDADKDSVYQQKVTDTVIVLKYLKPGKYSFRIIVDKNGNGIWDTGDLFAKLQPEVVLPHYEVVNLKAGWELIVDFNNKPLPKIETEIKEKSKGK